MTPAVRVTPRAFEDLKSIGRYTIGKWGRAQRDRYLCGIDARMQWLAEQPERGRKRDDSAPGYRCFA